MTTGGFCRLPLGFSTVVVPVTPEKPLVLARAARTADPFTWCALIIAEARITMES